MARRGNVRGKNVTTNTGYNASASGVFNMDDHFSAQLDNAWPSWGVVPGAPSVTGVSRVSGSGTSIDVTFTAPAYNGNQTITSYTAVSTPGSITATVSQAGGGTVRVTGLTQGTIYTFVVYATNIVGNSANSTASSAITAGTTPGAPTIGTPLRVSGSSTQIDVPFSAPASNGGFAITSYTAVSSPGGITGTLSQAGSGTIRVSGLTTGTSYTFTVYATNTLGNGASSAASSSIFPATVPSAPTIGTPTRVSGSSTQIYVPYTAPADNGSAITSYTAVSSPGGITGTLSQAGSGTITVSGLTAGTSYTFTVYATNGIGNSASSAASSSIFPASAPSAPTIGTPSRVSGSGTQIDVPFTAPANNGSAITSYTAVSTPGSITGTLSQAGSGTIRVSGLTQGTSYTFVVYATNGIGNSSNSSSSSAITPAVVPGAPTIGTATATGATTATVSFTAPASNGGLAITSYTAVSSPGGITGTLSQAGSGTITVSGLTKSTAYTFTVYATNGVGNGSSSSASGSITTWSDAPTSVSYLVVAGGGGGGLSQGGGGGGGGLLQGSSLSVTNGVTYTVTVGGGGAVNANGGSSVFSSVTATGGGRGGSASPYDPASPAVQNGQAGGSGGGGCGADNNSWATGSGGAGTPGQGYNGGSGVGSGTAWGGGGGGGGGAGQAGQNGQGVRNGGYGGSGAQWTVTGTYYSGGGGGSANCRSGDGTAGPGGAGGGGGGDGGCTPSPGYPGTTNTGGGGGATKSGGSGIVIIRYGNAAADAVATTGSPTYSNSGGYKTYTWTSSGSIRW